MWCMCGWGGGGGVGGGATQELQEALGLPEPELRRIVQSLVLGKYRLLTKVRTVPLLRHGPLPIQTDTDASTYTHTHTHTHIDAAASTRNHHTYPHSLSHTQREKDAPALYTDTNTARPTSMRGRLTPSWCSGAQNEGGGAD
jgi:hypothetical protein